MTWTAAQKSVAITRNTPHALSRQGVNGRNLGPRTVTFGPGELFGAAARCSHLHYVDPLAVTPESEMVKALVAHHVDDAAGSFSFLPSASRFKDFVATHFTGTVAAGIAYLTMVQDGYVWVDHFENLGGGNTAVTKSPDFVFARDDHSGAALLESKGTRKANSRQFDNRVADGYLDQVEPHLGCAVGNAIASHGFCIGSWMLSGNSAELYVHGTAPTPVAGQAAGRSPVGAIQRGNYATAFGLAHGPALAEQIRSGAGFAEGQGFLQFEWLDRQWLTSSIVLRDSEGVFFGRYSTENPPHPLVWERPFRDPRIPLTTFAIEKNAAEAALRAFSLPATERIPELHIEPLGPDIRGRAREEYWGAVFPDGLAVVSPKSALKNLTWAYLDQNGRVREKR